MEHQGEALRTILIDRRVSITELAKKLKVSRTTVYNWFEMVIVPYEHLEEMSDKLGLDLFEEIRKVLSGRKEKFYKPLKFGETGQVTEPGPVEWKSPEKTAVTLFIDGTENNLEMNIQKLKALSAALSSA
jgi:transcriptional regulator with XRE-family HTH domain